MTAYITVFVALAGLLIFMFASPANKKLERIGEMLLFSGILSTCIMIANQAKRLFVFALIGLFTLSLAGCTYCRNPANTSTPVCKIAQVSKKCGAPEVVKLVLQYLPEAIIDLISGNYMQLLTDLMARITALGGDGPTVVSCIVQTADANAASPNGAAVPAELLMLHEHAAAWFLAHPAVK